MLPLSNPLWVNLQCHCTSGARFAEILAGYHGGHFPSTQEELYEDLLECICGGQIYDSSYAAAPHLTYLAGRASDGHAAVLLCFAAHAIAGSTMKDAPPLSPGLGQFFPKACEEGLVLAGQLIQRLPTDSPELPELKNAMLAFQRDDTRCLQHNYGGYP